MPVSEPVYCSLPGSIGCRHRDAADVMTYPVQRLLVNTEAAVFGPSLCSEQGPFVYNVGR